MRLEYIIMLLKSNCQEAIFDLPRSELTLLLTALYETRPFKRLRKHNGFSIFEYYPDPRTLSGRIVFKRGKDQLLNQVP